MLEKKALETTDGLLILLDKKLGYAEICFLQRDRTVVALGVMDMMKIASAFCELIGEKFEESEKMEEEEIERLRSRGAKEDDERIVRAKSKKEKYGKMSETLLACADDILSCLNTYVTM